MIIVMLTLAQAKAVEKRVKHLVSSNLDRSYETDDREEAAHALHLLKQAIEQHEGRLCPACGGKKP